MTLTIPDSISSREDLAAVIQEIRTYANWLQQHSIAKRVGATGRSDKPELSAAAVAIMTNLAGDAPLDASLVDTLITALDVLHRSAESITITLAAPVTSDVRAQLVAWMRNNIAPNVFVTFSFNSTLLGGMVVRCGSRIFDWSFRRQIMNERHTIGEVLRHV